MCMFVQMYMSVQWGVKGVCKEMVGPNEREIGNIDLKIMIISIILPSLIIIPKP